MKTKFLPILLVMMFLATGLFAQKQVNNAVSSTSIDIQKKQAETPYTDKDPVSVNRFLNSFSKGDIVIGTETNVDAHVPIEPYYGYSYSQQIYLQSEIGQAGVIEQIAFYLNGTDFDASDGDWVVYIGHTTKTQFDGTTDWVDIATLTEVYNADVIWTTGNEWIVIDIDDFTYNNTDNLVIAVDHNESGYNDSSSDFYCTETTNPRSLCYYSDGTNPDPAAPPESFIASSFIANLTLSFYEPPVSNDLSVSDLTPFGTFYNGYAGDYPEVLVSNPGLDDQVAYDVNISITDASTGANVYTETVSNPGIASGATYTCTMTALWEPAPGTYSLTATVILAGDENPGNNVTTSNVTVGEWYLANNEMPMNSYLGSSVAYSGSYGDLLFSIGGNTTSANNYEVFVYDINTQTWTTTTSVPEATVVGCSAGYGDKIFTQIGTSVNCYSFDIETETWTSTASLPEALRWTAATSVGDNIYLAGGLEGVDGASVYRYDTNTDTWTPATYMPIDAWGGDLITVGDKLVYVWGTQGGSYTGNAIIGEIDADDPDIISWTTTTAPAEFGTYKMTAAPLSNTSFIVTSGDYNGGWATRPNTYVYNIVTETWTRIADKTTAVLGYAAGSFFINNEVQYMVSTGYSGSLETKSEYYTFEVNTPMPMTYSPTINEIDVELDAPIIVTFDMDVMAAFTNTISINGVPTTYTVTGDMIIIDHADFDYSTTYTVTVDADIVMNTELIGTTNEAFEWVFTTLDETFTTTFNVDMTAPITTGEFVVGTDILYLTGSTNGWDEPGTNPSMQMLDGDADGIYTIELMLTNGDYDYKYFKNAGWDGGEWDGNPNRAMTVAGATTVNDVWANEYLVTFNVTDGTDPVDAIIDVDGETYTTTAGVVAGAFVVGEFTYNVTADGYIGVTDAYTVTTDADQVINIVLEPNAINDIIANVTITPNPTTGLVTIAANDNYNVQVIDVTGQVMTSLNMNSNNATLDISNLEAGLYFVRLSKDGVSASYKIIKK